MDPENKASSPEQQVAPEQRLTDRRLALLTLVTTNEFGAPHELVGVRRRRHLLLRLEGRRQRSGRTRKNAELFGVGRSVLVGQLHEKGMNGASSKEGKRGWKRYVMWSWNKQPNRVQKQNSRSTQ